MSPQNVNGVKFSDNEIKFKIKAKRMRESRNFSMKDAAYRMGLSVKKLEDIESSRNYGCHITLDIIEKVCVAYDVDGADLLPETIVKGILDR